jgi:hypothetical protein
LIPLLRCFHLWQSLGLSKFPFLSPQSVPMVPVHLLDLMYDPIPQSRNENGTKPKKTKTEKERKRKNVKRNERRLEICLLLDLVDRVCGRALIGLTTPRKSIGTFLSRETTETATLVTGTEIVNENENARETENAKGNATENAIAIVIEHAHQTIEIVLAIMVEDYL